MFTPGEITKSPKGFHCGNLTKKITQHNVATDNITYGCVPCFFPHNCLEDNVCYTGTSGVTCDICATSDDLGTFYRVGNSCLECVAIPWPAVCLGVLVFLLIYVICLRGFSVSVNTKLKLICHFVQILSLSIRVKIHWPELILRMIGILNFADFNSNIIMPGCLFPNLPQIVRHSIEWATSLGIPLLLLMCMYCIARRDNIKKKRNHGKNSVKGQRRTSFDRFVFTTWVVIYTPVALWSIHTYTCSGVFSYRMTLDQSREIFLYDQKTACEGWLYQIMQFTAIGFLIFYVVIGPFLLALVTLRQKKWYLLETQKGTYGPAYDSFKEKQCFWEALPLLRKGISVMITDTLPFDPFAQTTVLLTMSTLYTLLLILFQPYRKCYWRKPSFNHHAFYDILANVAICFLQSVGLTLTLGMQLAWLDYVTISIVAIVLIVWVIIILITPLETEEEDAYPVEEETETEVTELKPTRSRMKRDNKVGFVESLASVYERQRYLDF